MRSYLQGEPSPNESRIKTFKVIASIIGILLAGYLIAAMIFNTINRRYFKATSTLTEEGLRYEFSINKSTFHRGEPVIMKLIIRNVSDSPVEIYFDSHKDCEFIVKRIYNLGLFYLFIDVWNSTHGKYYSPEPKKIVIPPKKEIVYKAEWHQDLPSGELAKPGSYLFMVKLNLIGGKKLKLYTTGK